MRSIRLARRVLLAAACLAFAAAAPAQFTPAIPKTPPPRPAQAVAPVSAERPVLQGTELDQEALERQRLESENRRLREENARLKSENAELSARVDNFSRLGGSEVRAYCPDRETSRNTAGAETDCTRSGYVCEEVSGLCHSSCQTTDMCAVGWVCDTSIEQCIVPSGGD
jgi:hypothetical protein